MKKISALVAAISLGLTASFAVLPVASAHSVQAKSPCSKNCSTQRPKLQNHLTSLYPHFSLPHLYSNVGTSDIPFISANTPVTIVSVAYVRPGFYEVSFDGSIRFTINNDDIVTCYIAVNGNKQSGVTTLRENTDDEDAPTEIMPFAVTGVVYVPLGGTVSGVCQDTQPSSGDTVLSGAQITLVQGMVDKQLFRLNLSDN